MTPIKALTAEIRKRLEAAMPMHWDRNGQFFREIPTTDITPEVVDVPMTWPEVRAYGDLRDDISRLLDALERADAALDSVVHSQGNSLEGWAHYIRDSARQARADLVAIMKGEK